MLAEAEAVKVDKVVLADKVGLEVLEVLELIKDMLVLMDNLTEDLDTHQLLLHIHYVKTDMEVTLSVQVHFQKVVNLETN